MNRFKTLKDHVYDYITQQILEGKLMPSERINESDISEALSVSRTPVREALIQLSCEGMLENVPRKGFILKGTTEKEAAELYQIIGVLDAFSATLSYDALSESDYTKMEYHIQSMNFAIKSDNYEMYLEHQEAFHNVYLEKANNAVLADTITRLKNRFFTRGYIKTEDDQNKDHLQKINDEHVVILKLFKNKSISELADYIQYTHWTPAVAHKEILSHKSEQKSKAIPALRIICKW